MEALVSTPTSTSNKGSTSAVEEIHREVMKGYLDLKADVNVFFAPMSVSKILVLLKKLRESLERLFELPTRQQEEVAWLILNGCKLIYDIAQPLLWFNCGKYVMETLAFAVLCMEAVINLCTVRHMRFRMKLYSSVFYAALSQGQFDAASGILVQTERQVYDLKEREELDPPLPQPSIACIVDCLEDVTIMKFILDVWKDSDSIDFSAKTIDKYSQQFLAQAKSLGVSSLRDCNYRFANEIIRVHLLSSGNHNETYHKRSTMILKASQALIAPLVSLGGDLVNNSNTALCLVEIMYINILENGALSKEDVEAVSTMIQSFDESELKGSLCEKLKLLRAAHDILEMPEFGLDTIENFQKVIELLNSLIFSDSSYRSRSILCKFAMEMVRRVIYNPLQKVLSSKEVVNFKVLRTIAYGLVGVVDSLQLAFCHDPIFQSSLAVLAGNFLIQIEDWRGSIGFLKQAIQSLEDQRASRVDFALSLPEDARDILAIQRASFTTRSDHFDWFHSIKRLGAHAFAGFGIFGLGSSADRADQALGEIHTELLALYFRSELNYGLEHYIARKRQKIAKAQAAEAAAAAAVAFDKTSKKKSKEATKSLAPVDSKTNDNLSASMKEFASPFVAVSIEKLPIFNALKISCARNNYAVSLLMMEASKLESDANLQKAFIQNAYIALDEVEKQEEKLTTTFKDLLLTTNTERRMPIILSRSHKYIYVAPVACRKLKHVAYYKVLAKERGNGSEISVYNTDMPGCENNISVEHLSSFKNSVVRIGPLRNGELYVFGSAGYTSEGKIVGGVSPTTPAIEAANPLPTIMLWSILGQTAQTLGFSSIAMDASLRVCQRYFLRMPRRSTASITSGRNIFAYEEPVLCSLAVHQSTTMLLAHFVMSFIRYETLYYKKEVFGAKQNWNYRSELQIRTLNSFARCGVVTTLASSLANQELVVKCVNLGDLLFTELARYDIIPLAGTLQATVACLVLALQRVNKRHWHDAENILYFKLTAALIQLGITSSNLRPVVSIMNDFYPEIREKTVDKLVEPSISIVPFIEALIQQCNLSLGESAKATIIEDLKKLANIQKYVTDSPSQVADLVDFWKTSTIQRRFKVLKKASDLVSPAVTNSEKAELEKALLADLPLSYSDYLAVVVLMLEELFISDQFDLLEIFLKRFPICLSYLCPELQEFHQQWSLTVCLNIDEYVEFRSASAAAADSSAAGKKAAAPPKKGAAEVPVENPFEQLRNIPDRFLQIDDTERQLQSSYMADILMTIISSHERNRGVLNYFIKSVSGPQMRVLPDNSSSLLDTSALAPLQPSGVVSGSDIIKIFGAAISLYVQAGKIDKATNVGVKLWNYIVGEYLDPYSFSHHFNNERGLCLATLAALVTLSEKNVESAFSSGINGVPDQSSLSQESQYSLRDMNDKSNSIDNLVVYLVKVVWIFREFPQDVVVLSSRLYLAFEKSSRSSFKRFFDECWQLVKEAQDNLISQATADLKRAQETIDNFVLDYEEAQKKKRKKKLRIARTEKDEEELIFDAEKAVLEAEVEKAKYHLESRKMEKDDVDLKQTQFNEIVSKGELIITVARTKLEDFLLEISQNYGAGVNFQSLIDKDQHISDTLAEVQGAYVKVAKYLREKKERVQLVEVLDDLTNILIRFGKFREVNQYLFDVVDGLFNTMDACLNWRSVTAAALESFDYNLVPGLVYVIKALGKLSKFCATNDYNKKAQYSRMAAEVARIFYQESIGHPVSLHGFACYECKNIGGFNSFRNDSLRSLFIAFEEHIQVLSMEGVGLRALPIIVLGEHIAAVYIRSPSQWLTMRIHRVRILIAERMFAEAISMLAGVKFWLSKINKHAFVDFLRQESSSDTNDLNSFDLSANDLKFYGVPPFLNNLPPDDEKSNAKSLEWVAKFPSEIEAILDSLDISVPESELTEEERQIIEEKKAKAAEAAAEAAKKSKGKAPVVEETNAAGDLPKRSIFHPSHKIALFILSAQLLNEILFTNTFQASKIWEFALKQQSVAETLLTKAKEILYTKYEARDINEFFTRLLCLQQQQQQEEASESKEGSFLSLLTRDFPWLDLYTRIFQIENNARLSRRKFRETLAAVTRMQKLLKHPSLSVVTGDQKLVLSFLWFSCRDFQLRSAEGQARRKELLQIGQRALVEASAVQAGYWRRVFLLRTASACAKLGRASAAVQYCADCISDYEQNAIEDTGLVACLIQRASSGRELARIGTYLEVFKAAEESLKYLRRGAEIAQRLALLAGAYPPDYNITYVRTDDPVTKHNLLPPILHNFTDLHGNDQPLRITSNDAAPFNRGSGDELKQNLRLGPIDATDRTFSPSEFANIYLMEVRSFLNCQVALLETIDDIRSMGIHRIVAPRRENSDDSHPFDSEILLLEQVHLGEYILKLMRQCYAVAPAVRGVAYMYTAKARISQKSPAALGHSHHLKVALLEPLTAGLKYLCQVDATYTWTLMRLMCIEAVKLFGDFEIDLGDDNAARLKQAAAFLLTAIKLGGQYFKICFGLVDLSADASFASVSLSEELSSIAAVSFTASTTPELPPDVAPEPPKDTGADPKKGGKAAPAKGAPVAAAPASVLTGRDALFLLSSTLREIDVLKIDSPENSLAYDLHYLIKKTFSAYDSQCCLKSIPGEADPLSVPVGSVSSLWEPVATPKEWVVAKSDPLTGVVFTTDPDLGYYSHAAIFLLLGDAKAKAAAPAAPPAKGAKPDATDATAAAANSNEPILTKVVVYRGDVMRLERQLRIIRDRQVFYEADNQSCADYQKLVCEAYATIVYSLYLILKHGSVPQDSIPENFWTSDNLKVVDNSIKICLDSKLILSLPLSPKAMAVLADVLCMERDVLTADEPELCTLLRYTLGFKV